jgi:hypothetical protein
MFLEVHPLASDQMWIIHVQQCLMNLVMWKNVMQGKVLFQVIDPIFDTGDIKFYYLKINKVIIGM